MPRNFDWLLAGGVSRRGPRFWLQITGAALVLLNGIALFLYLDPPGGSRKELMQQRLEVRTEIVQARAKATRVQSAAAKVQLGNTESTGFETKYFLAKRTAYGAVIAEIQKMAAASGLEERDAVYTEDPIEGAPELAVLNCTANYEGGYANLMRFLYQVDESPMLLMLENMQAAPQQKGGQIAASIRFQAIIEEELGGGVGIGGQ